MIVCVLLVYRFGMGRLRLGKVSLLLIFNVLLVRKLFVGEVKYIVVVVMLMGLLSWCSGVVCFIGVCSLLLVVIIFSVEVRMEFGVIVLIWMCGYRFSVVSWV